MKKPRKRRIVDDPRWVPFIRRYAFDLTRFSIEVCGMIPTPDQKTMFDSVSPPGSRTTVRSGHGTGKTRGIAVIALWHLLCFYLSNTLITATKLKQVKNLSWKEVMDMKDAIRRGPHAWIEAYFTVEAERIYINGFKPQWYIIANTAPRGTPENLAGEHRKWYLIIADEASAIPDANFGVLTGALTDALNRMLMVSQPTRDSGFFYDSHNKLSTANGGVWNAIRMNSEKSPRVSKAFIQEKREQYSEEEYTIKVLGEFPENRGGNLLGRSAIEACFGLTVIREGDLYGNLLTCDVGAGEYRDKSVATLIHVTGHGDFGADARRVQVQQVPFLSNSRDLQNFTGAVFQIAAELENVTTLVDFGGMGVAVCQGLESLGLPYVKRVKWGEVCWKRENTDRFFNLRAQAMVCASRAAKEGRLGIANGPWRKDILDQASRVPYSFDDKARYKIATKEDMQSQGIPSPDVWDTICFAFLEGVDYLVCEASKTAPPTKARLKDFAESAFAGL